MNLTLYPHQQNFLDRNIHRHLLAFGTGLGKTLTAIEYIKKHKIRTTLVICPKTIKEQWEAELHKHLSIQPNLKSLVVTKEQFRDKFDHSVPADLVIVDEAHFFFGLKSRMHKTLKNYFQRHDTKHRLLLTATPVLSAGSMNVYATSLLLGKEVNYIEWRKTFQYRRSIGRGRFAWFDREDERTVKKLYAYLGKIGTFVSSDEVYKVPPQTTKQHLIKPPQALRNALQCELDGETEPIVIWTKTHRLEQRFKRDYVRDLASKYKRVMIVTRYVDELQEYSHLFNERPNVAVLSGKTKDRYNLIKSIQDKENYVFIVNSAISEGYELPHTEAIIYASLDFSIKNKIQMDGRALRMNKPSPTDIHIVVITGGSDQDVYKSIEKKEDFNLNMFIHNKKS